MQYTGPTSLSKIKETINANDLIPGTGLQASDRTWAVKSEAGSVGAVQIATITNTGPMGTENDYPDYHYWCIPQQNNTNISNGSFVPGAVWNLSNKNYQGSAGSYSNGSNWVITAVNPAEYTPNSNSSTHSLANGSTVSIAPVYMDVTDGTVPPIVRWVILGESSGPQQFIVYAIPNMSSGVVKPYVWCNTYSNTSTGTMNISVGVVIPHDVGDIFFAEPVSQINYNGDVLRDDGAGYKPPFLGAPVIWQEKGTWGTIFEAKCNQSGGSQGSAGAMCSYTYIMETPGGVPLFTTPQAPTQAGSRIFPMALSAATVCIGKIAPNTGAWSIVSVSESTSNFNCNTG